MDSTKYIIIEVAELRLINFETVNETALDTVRLSNDGTKCVISWNDEEPQCISSLLTKSEIYSDEQILEKMETSDWKKIL